MQQLFDYLTPLRAAFSYLVAHIRDDGRFDYSVDPNRGPLDEGYNFVRHAGTTYALWQAVRSLRVSADGRAGSNVLRATAFLIERIERVRGAVFLNTGEQYLLGAAALTLLTLVEARASRTHGSTPSTLVDEFANTIGQQQAVDGSFTCFLDRRTGKRLDRASVYYPGEAIFALARWANAGAGTAGLCAAQAGLTFLRSSLATADWSELALQHWSAKGIAELGSGVVHQADFLREIDAAVDVWLEYETAGWVRASCAALATKAEALLASARAWLQLGDASRAASRGERAAAVLLYALEFQYGSDEARVEGGFASSALNPVVRIDNVQHVMSALLDYGSLLDAMSDDSRECRDVTCAR